MAHVQLLRMEPLDALKLVKPPRKKLASPLRTGGEVKNVFQCFHNVSNFSSGAEPPRSIREERKSFELQNI